MKKHNKLFYISITGLLLVVVGTCMIGAGISAGGSKTFLSVNESTASWWPFSASVGFGDGEWDNKEIFHGSVKKSFTPKNIIELHVAVGDIEIDDEKYAYGETSLNANTKQNIQINCSTGSVEINFR